MARTFRSGVALALALVAVAPLTSAHAGGARTGDDLATCRPQVKIGKDGWARIESPPYASGQGDRVIASSALPTGRPKRVYVTNGSVVKISESAGCKWDYIFPQQNRVAPPREVSSLVISQLAAPTDESLWIAAYESGPGATRPHVARTPNAAYEGGNTTEAPIDYLDDGLPLVGKPVSLAVPKLVDHAYVLIEEPHDADAGSVAPSRHLYRLTISNDLQDVTGAQRYLWQEVPLPPEVPEPVAVTLSAKQSETIWIWQGDTYALSNDAGTTWKTGKARGPITTVDVDDAGQAAVFSSAGDGGLMERVDYYSGTVRSALVTPVAVRVAAHGALSGVYAIHGEKRTYGYDPLGRTWVDITPKGGADFDDLHFGNALAGRILIGQSQDTLFRFDLFPNESFFERPVGEEWEPPAGDGVDYGLPTLTPKRQVVRVEPGKLADADVELDMPPSAGRIDVFFLIDTTSSMTAAIEGLQRGVRKIAEEVEDKTRGPACFGVGEVKDFSVDPRNALYGANAVTAYKLQKKITCGDLDGLSTGLEALTEGGGDGFPEEAQTIGLTQAVTGLGNVDPPVLPGQSAGFEAPTRVIVLITDAGFKMAPQHKGFPSMDETVDTLTKFGQWTHVVGMLLETKRGNTGVALEHLREVATRTKTFAPEGGVDCNRDGYLDLPAGVPLVCPANNYAPDVAPAIIALLLGVREPASIGVQAQDKHDVVAGVRGDGGVLTPAKQVSTIANIRVANKLAYRPVLTCRPEQDGLDLPVRVVGTRRQLVVAEAEIVVRCRAKPLPPKKRPPAPPDPELPPPPKPPLLPGVVPPFQPPPVNNPPPNINPNAGFSQQEEQQFQLAAVTQGAEESEMEEELELAMSAIAPDSAAARLVLGCAAMTSLGAAVAFGRRRRTQRAIRPGYARWRP